jgi:signal peptidase I
VTTQESADSAAGQEPQAGEPGPKGRKKQLPFWQESILLLAIALGLAVLVKALLVQAFYIPSESMEPGLVKNDRILVQKVSYWFGGTPQRGDVVVFKDPGNWLPPSEAAGPTGAVAQLMEKVGLYPSGGHLVKRVIGVAGDSIHCCDDQGRLQINGVSIDEQGYAVLDGASCYGPEAGCNWDAGPVPQGDIFVMGDNRNHSADSSYHLCRQAGCIKGSEFVPVDLVVGKVFALVWPWNRFTILHRPDAFADVPDKESTPVG